MEQEIIFDPPGSKPESQTVLMLLEINRNLAAIANEIRKHKAATVAAGLLAEGHYGNFWDAAGDVAGILAALEKVF